MSAANGHVTPKVNGPDGTEVVPVYTETFRATTQNDTLVHKTLCGETEIEAIGEDEWRITLEGLVLKSQLQDLFAMRPANNELTVIGEARVHRGVTFDRFTYEQTDEHNVGEFDVDGSRVQEPLFRFQLQTQDDQTV